MPLDGGINPFADDVFRPSTSVDFAIQMEFERFQAKGQD
jgi:hypothetical protein